MAILYCFVFLQAYYISFIFQLCLQRYPFLFCWIFLRLRNRSYLSWIQFWILNIYCSNRRFSSTLDASNSFLFFKLFLTLFLKLSRKDFLIFFQFFNFMAQLAKLAVVLAPVFKDRSFSILSSCSCLHFCSTFLTCFYNLSNLDWVVSLFLFLLCLSICSLMYFILTCISIILASRSSGSLSSRVPIIYLQSFCFLSYLSMRKTNYSWLTVPSEFQSRIYSTFAITSGSSENYTNFYFIYQELRMPSPFASINLNISYEVLASGKQTMNFYMGVSQEMLEYCKAWFYYSVLPEYLSKYFCSLCFNFLARSSMVFSALFICSTFYLLNFLAYIIYFLTCFMMRTSPSLTSSLRILFYLQRITFLYYRKAFFLAYPFSQL